MLSIRKTWWTALATSALLVGCTAEEAAPTADAPVVTPAPSTTAAPTTTSEAKPAEAVKPATSDMPKEDAPKVEAPKVEEPAPVETPKVEAPKVEAPKVDAPKVDAPKTAAASLNADELAEVKKLPADEQDAALAQALCPVSTEHLGSMGTPIKVSAEGKTLYLCCKGCQKDFDADPKAVLAKLAK